MDLSDILSVRTIKMESVDNNFDVSTDVVDGSDPLSMMPQYVTESDLGLLQSTEILQSPNIVFDSIEDDDTMQSSDSNEEVIIQLMDIRTRLSHLKAMLERRLGLDLTEYSFWLQDAKMLENHKTLVEQCIRGEGVVQVNIQIKVAERKINILDVLKPDEELLQMPQKLEEDVEEDFSVPPTPAEAHTEVKDDSKHAAAVKWVVDANFRTQHRARVPEDPEEWSVQHVKLWVQWAVRQFNLIGVKLTDWNIGGAQLCNMTNLEFKEKVPSDPGDMFWTHFELLRKCKFVAVVLNETEPAPPKYPLMQSAIKKKPKAPLKVNKSPLQEEDVIISSLRNGNNGQVQLWQFLLDLLTSAEHYDVIRWHGTEGEFKLLEPEKVAKLWGARKHKPAMNYEKLSRALRYYYDGDMISKVGGKRFVYKFVCDLEQLIGYSAAELSDLVRETYETLLRGNYDDNMHKKLSQH